MPDYTPPNGSLIRIEQVPRTIPAAALALEDEQGVVAALTCDGSLVVYDSARLERLSAGWDMPGRTAMAVMAKLIIMAAKR